MEFENINDLVSFLEVGNSSYNIYLAHVLGLNPSIVYNALIEMCLNSIADNKSNRFTCRIEELFLKTTLKYKSQKTALEVLEKHKLIEVDCDGLFNIRHIRINLDSNNLQALIEQGKKKYSEEKPKSTKFTF